MLIKRSEIATALALVMAASTALAQEEPKKQDPAQEPEKAEATSSREPILQWPHLRLGESWWQLSGSERKFRQYATPPKGLSLLELQYKPIWNEGRHEGFLNVRTPGQPDNYLLGAASLNFGSTRGELENQNTEYYDPTPTARPLNGRQTMDGFFRQSFGGKLSLALKGRQEQVDKYPEPPYDDIHERTRTWVGSLGGEVLGGFLDLNVANWRYWDRTNKDPDSTMNRLGVSYMRSFGSNLNVEGSIARSVVEQPGRKNSKINGWSFGATYDFSDRTNLQLDVRDEKLDLPGVSNAYVRARHIGRIELNQQIGKWSGQIAYKREEVERVRDDHSFVDNPRWHNLDLRISGRIAPNLRLTVRGKRQSLDGKFAMQGTDPRAMYWRNTTRADVKLDAYIQPIIAYAVYSFNDQSNDVRAVKLNQKSLLFGASAEASERLEVYTEMGIDTSNARSPEAGNLGAFFPSGNVFVLGANWNLGENSYANISYTRFATGNDNPLGLRDGNVDGSFYTASFFHRVTDRYELGLTLAPWVYSDAFVPQMGYKSTLITLSARGRF